MKCIEIKGARQNNLKLIHLKVPLGFWTVVCGPSGSGKSSLAFETLFAEGYRRFTQTLSHQARRFIQQMPKPLVKSITNIPPALALEQKNKVRSARPTVATFTELADYLRLLFTHLSEVICPVHHTPLSALPPSGAAEAVLKAFAGQKGFVLTPLAVKNWKELKAKLLKDGWRSIGVIKNKPFGIKEFEIRLLKKKPKAQLIYLILDRLVFKDKKQLSSSLSSAYKFLRVYNQSVKACVRVVSVKGGSLFFNPARPVCRQCAYCFSLPVQAALFNFNSSLGACPSCKGFGCHLLLDENKIVPAPWKSLAQGAVEPFTIPSAVSEKRALRHFCHERKIDWHSPWEKLPPAAQRLIWEGEGEFAGIKGFFSLLENRKYKMPVRVFLSRYKSPKLCEVCQGSRFRKELSQVVFRSKTLPELFLMDIESLTRFFKQVKFSGLEKKKAPEVIRKIEFLLEMLSTIGLSYLGLNREARSLSSGELQRLSLVHQLGLGLSNTLYVLDEPTVGLHPSDTRRLIQLLERLKLLGNTLVVVEHDPDLIKKADFVLELGPGAGSHGGKLMFAGSTSQFLKSNTLTSSYLSQSRPKGLSHSDGLNARSCVRSVDAKNYKYFLEITNCRTRNLKNVDFRLPLNRLVCVTGVSGSGKTSLVLHTLYPALARALGKKAPIGSLYSQLKGAHYLQDTVLISTVGIDKSKRSLPATYLRIYDSIRAVMGKAGNVKPRAFSLNVDGGRCPMCRGLGYLEVEMVFMDPVRIVCEDCRGKRFQNSILDITWRGKNIHQILSMTVQQALDFFVSYPEIWKPLALLKKVGLEYLILGQNLASLSGGEAQRLRLARELLQTKTSSTLYILDEPTVGLHFKEVHLLLNVLEDLVKKGNTVLLIEHNMEMIARADYVIDIGPGAGARGGRIVAEGAPQEAALHAKGHTAPLLKRFLKKGF